MKKFAINRAEIKRAVGPSAMSKLVEEEADTDDDYEN